MLQAPVRADLEPGSEESLGAAGAPAIWAALLLGVPGARRRVDRPSSSTVTAWKQAGQAGMWADTAPTAARLQHGITSVACSGAHLVASTLPERAQDPRPWSAPHSRRASPNDLRLLISVAAIASWKPVQMKAST